MALATRCPNCQALFRVVADQLKLRGGLVRCGACRHVFDAIGSLAYVDDQSSASPAAPVEPRPQRIAGSMASLLTPTSAPDAAGSPSAPPPGAPMDPFLGDETTPADREAQTRKDESTGEADREEAARDDLMGDEPRDVPVRGQSAHAQPAHGHAARDDGEAPREPDATDESPPDPFRSAARHRPRRRRPEAPDSPDGTDPLAVPTLLATHADATVDLNALRAERRGKDTADSAEQSDEEARRRRRRERHARRAAEREAQRARAAEDGGDEEAPEFLRAERRRRGFSVVFGGGSAVLTLLLFVQAAVLFRTEFVTRWPSLRPALVQLCAVTGCTVSWPTRADLLAVVGTELQAIPGTDVLELRTVIRNRASFKVALPAIEVSLTDTQNRTIARKVFAPVDYLSSSGEPAARIDEGLGAGSDYEVRIAFEARGVSAVGFVVYPFYL